MAVSTDTTSKQLAVMLRFLSIRDGVSQEKRLTMKWDVYARLSDLFADPTELHRRYGSKEKFTKAVENMAMNLLLHQTANDMFEQADPLTIDQCRCFITVRAQLLPDPRDSPGLIISQMDLYRGHALPYLHWTLGRGFFIAGERIINILLMHSTESCFTPNHFRMYRLSDIPAVDVRQYLRAVDEPIFAEIQKQLSSMEFVMRPMEIYYAEELNCIGRDMWAECAPKLNQLIDWTKVDAVLADD